MKKILGSVVIIYLVAMLSIGATKAYFSNQGTSSGNTFSTGTLDLKLSDDNETVQDSVTATWTGTNLAPGIVVSGTLKLRNSGTIAANHVEIGTANLVTEASSGPGTEETIKMDTVLEVTTLTFDGANLLNSLPDGNINGIKDLDDMEAYTFDSLALTDLDTDHPLVMTVRFHPTMAENQHQGDSVVTTFTLTLNQDSSQ